jgi:hypothetical protein
MPVLLCGLDTWQLRDEELYRERGKKTAREGYVSMSHEYLPTRAPQTEAQR